MNPVKSPTRCNRPVRIQKNYHSWIAQNTVSGTTIRQIYAAKGQLDRLYDTCLPTGLWCLHTNEEIQKLRHALYPVLRPFVASSGRTRSADIEVYSNEGIPYVRCGTGGVSLFDEIVDLGKPGVYLYAQREVKIPAGLVVSKNGYRKSWKATHYTIHPEYDMPVWQFLHLSKQFTCEFTHAASTICR